MKALKVNADYELVLFTGQIAPKQLNEAIEFLPFFLEDAPVLSSRTYAPEYLSYIQSLRGTLPRTILSGESQNWWGELKNLPLERKLNSKITSTQIMIEKGWCDHTFVVEDGLDESLIHWERHYVLKDPYGMSGQKFEILSGPRTVKEMSKKGPVILEPLFNRIHDFSHYVFPDSKRIAYQNFVDSRFQYKGSFFPKLHQPTVESLSFYHEITPIRWGEFLQQVEIIIEEYRSMGATGGFSIDSFTYREEGELKIRVMSEVNYRRTMGKVAWELAQKYAVDLEWNLFVLIRPQKFNELKKKIERVLWTPGSPKGVIILSPGDTRFSMLYLMAENSQSGNKLIEELNDLLPGGEFPVKLENDFPGFFG